jgi:hypothetical protein
MAILLVPTPAAATAWVDYTHLKYELPDESLLAKIYRGLHNENDCDGN